MRVFVSIDEMNEGNYYPEYIRCGVVFWRLNRNKEYGFLFLTIYNHDTAEFDRIFETESIEISRFPEQKLIYLTDQSSVKSEISYDKIITKKAEFERMATALSIKGVN